MIGAEKIPQPIGGATAQRQRRVKVAAPASGRGVSASRNRARITGWEGSAQIHVAHVRQCGDLPPTSGGNCVGAALETVFSDSRLRVQLRMLMLKSDRWIMLPAPVRVGGSVGNSVVELTGEISSAVQGCSFSHDLPAS